MNFLYNKHILEVITIIYKHALTVMFNDHFEILHTMYQKIKSKLLPDSWNQVRKYKLPTKEHVNDENW